MVTTVQSRPPRCRREILPHHPDNPNGAALARRRSPPSRRGRGRRRPSSRRCWPWPSWPVPQSAVSLRRTCGGCSRWSAAGCPAGSAARVRMTTGAAMDVRKARCRGLPISASRVRCPPVLTIVSAVRIVHSATAPTRPDERRPAGTTAPQGHRSPRSGCPGGCGTGRCGGIRCPLLLPEPQPVSGRRCPPRTLPQPAGVRCARCPRTAGVSGRRVQCGPARAGVRPALRRPWPG
jgi:hypothetical protein